MVGFPGEDEPAFDRTRSLVEQAGLAYLHVFGYSSRPGTSAARLPGALPRSTVHERSRILRRLDRELRRAFGASLRGRPLPVLVEGRGPDGLWSGLTEQFVRVAIDSPLDLGRQVLRVRLERPLGNRWLARPCG
jgi:threonylcarbamoyladenosine tRNA methylthiotransferase MtaB